MVNYSGKLTYVRTYIHTYRQTDIDTQTDRHNLSNECSLFWWNVC